LEEKPAKISIFSPAGLFFPRRIPVERLHTRHVRDSSLKTVFSGGLSIYASKRVKRNHMVEIYVRQNNVDQALRALKKKLQNEGVLREMKARKHYEKPSEKRVREKAEAVRRARKLARKRAQLEGLIPMKKKPPRRY
jgi:small subunit ribosomal protein S21